MMDDVSSLSRLLPDIEPAESPWAMFEQLYHVPVLVVLAVYMVAIRLQTYGRFVTDSGVFFSGNDAWYHFRAVKYSVVNWPFTIGFDPMTGFPEGAAPGQFGTLFDQILATVALVIGLGSPSDALVRTVMVVAPPVIGALCLVPVYLIGKRLHSRAGVLLGALALALLPGVFLRRSLVGVADHNIAEPLFMGLAVVALLGALTRANRDVLVADVLWGADRTTIRKEFTPSVVAGLALAAYLLVWPPAVLLVGIGAVFYTVYAAVGSVLGRRVESVLLVGATSNLVAALVLVFNIDTFQTAVASIGPLQIALTAGVGLWCGGLIALARRVEQAGLPRYAFTGGVTLSVLGGTALGALVLPEVAQLVWTNVLRVVGFGQHANTLTIGEAQPFIGRRGLVPSVLSSYGLLFSPALIGLGLLVTRVVTRLRDGEHAAVELFVVIWTLFITAAAFTQVRFNYYLAPVVAILAGYGVIRLLQVVNVPSSVPRLEPHQYVSVLLVLMVVFVPVLVYPVGTTSAAQAQNHGVGEYAAWDEPLEWMNNNTPEYDSLEQYGSYEQPAGDRYEYEDDVYGVMSWWDYGHYTTVTAERAPVANPFQQNAEEAAQFLLAENESQADTVLAEMNATDTRYVAVDWKMVTPDSKFGAPVVWHPGLEQADMYEPVYQQGQNGRIQLGMNTMTQRYYESLMVRLYHYQGSAKRPAPLVVDYQNQTVTTQSGDQLNINVAKPPQANTSTITRFRSQRAAAGYIEQNQPAHVGGVGLQPREKVDALEQYRLVKTSDREALASNDYEQSIGKYTRFGQVKYSDFATNRGWVKLYERVPGATITGSNGPADSVVVAQVEMNDPTEDNSTFIYRQYTSTDGNGAFNMTVPYSTTGYDEYGPANGYTNLSVTATGPYQFTSIAQNESAARNITRLTDTAAVPEGAVNGESNETVTVRLEAQDTET